MSGGHSNTTNGVTVLGTGPRSNIIFERPSSSGKRSTTPKLQRTGSTLEILPNESESSILSNSKIKEDNQQSGVSDFDSKINSRPSSWSSKKNGGDAKSIYSDSTHKKVVLPSVKRDFEKHGMPNNEEFEAFVRSTTPTVDLQTEKLSQSLVSSLQTGIQGLGLETKSNAMTNSVKQFTTLNNDYYVSHQRGGDGSNQQGAGKFESDICRKLTDGKVDSKNSSVKQVTTLSDDYYVSHRQSNSFHSDIDDPSAQGTSKNDDEESSDESDNDDEEIKAPIELLGEFLEAVMDEDFENAQKLCKMILIYEPNNKEANEFKPLIDEELRKERERQLWGSSSSEDESSDEAESDDETDDSDDDEEDEDEDKKSNDTSDSN